VIIDYFCFHDTDLIQEGETFVESEKRVATITDYIKDKQAEFGVKLSLGKVNQDYIKKK
jgi:xylose isomerase